MSLIIGVFSLIALNLTYAKIRDSSQNSLVVSSSSTTKNQKFSKSLNNNQNQKTLANQTQNSSKTINSSLTSSNQSMVNTCFTKTPSNKSYCNRLKKQNRQIISF